MDAKNAQILGVSFDSVEDNRKFAEKQNFPYPLLSEALQMGIKYGAADEGATAGNARRVGYVIGPDGRIKAVWPKASPATFAQDVLATL